jgi:hypothetical protein
MSSAEAPGGRYGAGRFKAGHVEQKDRQAADQRAFRLRWRVDGVGKEGRKEGRRRR